LLVVAVVVVLGYVAHPGLAVAVVQVEVVVVIQLAHLAD
jgi:hypothetical protein